MNAIQTASAVSLINTLDLGAIKSKLMHVASGEGWSAAHADAVETEYRRFLTLMKLYPNEATAPLVDVDTFWHYHILDTAKYAVDCAHVFGYFLHHYPYLGMDGEEDEVTRDTAGARMQELYAATFGVSMAANAPSAWCGAATAHDAQPVLAWCGAASTAPIKQNLAWCGMASTAPVKQDLAWCGMASTAPVKQNLAWCGMASTAPVKQNLAWCGMASTAPVKKTLAWCGAATTQKAQQSLAWSGAAHPVVLKVGEDITLSVLQAA
jgi:hypothetical protein